MELSEYQIDFSSQTTIQGQALADFIVECSLHDNSDDDKLLIKLYGPYMDLKCRWINGKKTQRCSFILDDPDGHQYAYAIKFLFFVSNNKAEYEALFVGLCMAQSLKLTHLCVRSDSQVVIGQSLVLMKRKGRTCRNTWCVFKN